MSAAAWRFFLAPQYTTDDYDATVAECRADSDEAKDQLLRFYYCYNDWKEVWRDHRAEIQAEFAARFPDPEKRAAHKRWALQSYSDRLHDRFIAERDRNPILQ
jgi:hypothetical protein